MDITIIRNNVSLNYMTMIDPATGWFKIVEILAYNLDKVMVSNDENIDTWSVRVIQWFNTTWICINPRPKKVMFDNGSEFNETSIPC